MRVALYMRYSSDRQTEQSIEGQQRVCQEFCQREKHTIVATYIDRATSAFKDTEKRREFARMIKDSEKHLFDAVVVYKLDRFARNRYDSATYKARLKKNGVRVISATENISDNPEGVILEAVLEGMAEFYSLELSQKIKRGMNESAHKAHSTGGQIPLGYKIVDKTYAVDEAAAPIVQEAFTLYASGKSIKEMCNIFNAKGYRSSTGQPFNKNSFKKMLRNEKYIGVYKYADIRIEDAIPALIDKDTFRRVQEMLTVNAEAPAKSKAKVEYLLSQKLFCGHCGAKFVGDGGVGKHGKPYYYYTCGNRKYGNGCNKKSIKKELIEDTVAEEAVKLLTPEMIEYLADAAVKANNELISADKTCFAIKAEIADCETRINNLLKLAETGTAPQSLLNRVGELEKQIADAEKRLKTAQAEQVVLDKSHIVWFLEQFCAGDIKDEAFKKRLIDLLICSVTLWDLPDGGYKMTIVFNLRENSKKTVILNPDDGIRISNPTLHQEAQILNLMMDRVGVTILKKQTA